MAKDSFTFPWDSHLHGTHEYIESLVHLKILVTLNSNVLQIENKFNKIIKIVLLGTFDVLLIIHEFLNLSCIKYSFKYVD